MPNPKSRFLVRALWDGYERAVVPKERIHEELEQFSFDVQAGKA